MRRRPLLLALALAFVACSDYGAEEATPNRGDGDAGVDAAPTPDGASVSTDASDAAASTSCTAGAVVAPIRAFNASPDETDPVCSLDAILAQDDVVAGLDRTDGSNVSIGGVQVGGCIGVELAADVVVAKIVVRARAAGNACGVACANVDGGCGTGRGVLVFIGDSQMTLRSTGAPFPLNDTLETFEVEPPAAVQGRFLAVCRQATGAARDDVAVDFLGARCR